MRVISRWSLREHWELAGREDSREPLLIWYDVASHAGWKDFSDVKRDFGARVDQAHGKTIFDIGGNKYRLVCLIDYRRHGVLVLWVGTHREYDALNRNNGKKLKEL
jgi:mRNA interferase HigB